jgi:DNA-directed RNA polymerase specialized sigma24 family protein
MKRECRRIYTRAFGAITDNDWDAAFNFAYGQAWKVEREKGSIDSLTAWLTTAAHNAVVSEHRKTGRVELLATEEFLTQPAVTDLADTVEDRQILRDAIFCLKSTLPERVRLVWTMRFAGDYEPGEIQRHLNISKKAYEKDLELASRLVVDRLETARESGVCKTPDMTSMVRAYAIWGDEHGAERAKLAREHLDECPACRRTVLVLRAAQRAAAFLPPPILGLTAQHSPALGVVLQTTESAAARIQDGLWRLTGRVQDGLLRMKHGLMKLVSRGPASGPVGADRTATVLGASGTSGAALATKAVVGCLAAGVLASGTGACLKAAGVGVPGLSGLIHSITGSPHHRADVSRSPRDYWTAPAENLSAVPSSNALQSVPVHPARTVIPARNRQTIRKPVARALSSTVAARSDFGSAAQSTPQPSQAEASAARNEFSTSSHLARSASTNGTGSTQEAPPSQPHTGKASTKAAEGEFEGP